MPVITQIEKSRVIDISGQALIRRANGKLEPVQVGELVPRGAQLLVAEDSWVELRQEIEPRPLAEGLMLASAPVETANDMGNELDRLLDAVSRGDARPALIETQAWLDRPWKDARENALNAFERAYIDGLLRATGGRIGETAQRAGMDPRSLHEKMRRHGLRKEDYRS